MNQITEKQLKAFDKLGIESSWVLFDNGKIGERKHIPFLFIDSNCVPEISTRPGNNEGIILSVVGYKDRLCCEKAAEICFKCWGKEMVKKIIIKLLS